MSGLGDVLLRWLSELGRGELRDVKPSMSWLALKTRPRLEQGATGRWLRDASALGHMDVDWRNRRWSVAPPALTSLPFAGGFAVLCGSRLDSLERRLETLDDPRVYVHRVDNQAPDRDIPSPGSLIIQYDDPNDLPMLARRLQVRHVPCFALQAAALLPELSPGPLSPPPQAGRPVERYDSTGLVYRPVECWNEDGLYRQGRVDRKRIGLLKRGDYWHEVSHERGVYLELLRTKEERGGLRWLPEEQRGRERMGRLVVQWGYPLPDLQRRVAVMCSGTSPNIAPTTSMIIYENVPRAIAQKIAQSLGQPLGGSGD